MALLPGNIKVQRDSCGIWYCRPYLGINAVTGAPLRPYKSFPDAANREEAESAAAAWLATMDSAGAYGVAMRLDEVLRRYLASLEILGRAPATLRTYESCVRKHISPYIGNLAPEDVKPHTISLLYAQMMTSSPSRKPVGRNTVRKVHGFLTGAFKWMMKEGFVDRNPMLYVMPPAKDRHEAVAITGDSLELLIAALDAFMENDSTDPINVISRNCAFAAYTSLWSGIREGEMCALARCDAKRSTGFLHIHANASEDGHGHVERRLKTKGKISRNVAMPQSYFDRLDEHYAWQDSYLDQSIPRDGLTVCATASGSMIAPSTLSRWFAHLRQSLKLPRDIKYHSLRHTHASILLAEGVDLKTIAERLGHAKETLTLETYSHVMPGRDQYAAEVFAAFAGDLRGGGP